MHLAALLQDLQELGYSPPVDAPIVLSFLKGQLKGRAPYVAQQNQRVVGVDEGVLGVVAGLELVEGRIGRKGKNMALQVTNWRTE